MFLNGGLYNGDPYGGTGSSQAGVEGQGSLCPVSVATSTGSITGIGIARGTGILIGVSATTAVTDIEGIGIMVSAVNQIRAPDGGSRIWRDIHGNPITFNSIGG